MSGHLHVSTPARLPRYRQCAIRASRLWGRGGDSGRGRGREALGQEVRDPGFGAETATYPHKRLAREARERGTFTRYAPMRCTHVREATREIHLGDGRL